MTDLTDYFVGLLDQYQWLHIRYDSEADPAQLIEKLGSTYYLYSRELMTKGHSKDHVHMVVALDKIPSAPTINKYIDSIHSEEELEKGINRGTSKVRTTHLNAMQYILKAPDDFVSRGIPPETIKTLKKMSFEKVNKDLLHKEHFLNEYAYYNGKITLEKFGVYYSDINDKYLIDKPDFSFKAYLRKHYMHKHPKVRRARAEMLVDQVKKECDPYSEFNQRKYT